MNYYEIMELIKNQIDFTTYTTLKNDFNESPYKLEDYIFVQSLVNIIFSSFTSLKKSLKLEPRDNNISSNIILLYIFYKLFYN